MTLLIAVMVMGAVVGAMFHIARNSPSHEETQQELAAKLTGNADKELIEDAADFLTQVEALRQTDIHGDMKAHDAILNKSYDGPWPERRGDGGWLSMYDDMRILKIAGMQHRTGLSRYCGQIGATLVPEPQNESDPDAIKVVASDRHHLGYVQMGQTDFVCSMANGEFPYRCTVVINEIDDDDEKHYEGYMYLIRR